MFRVNGRIDNLDAVLFSTARIESPVPVAFACGEIVQVFEFEATPRALWREAFFRVPGELPAENVPAAIAAAEKVRAELARQAVARSDDLFVSADCVADQRDLVGENKHFRCPF